MAAFASVHRTVTWMRLAMDDGELGIGQDFGGYVIAGLAGAGGMGIVYRAEQRALARTVALKIIRPEIAQSREYRWRFLREANLASAVDHPHIVTVFDVGEHSDRLFMAMQWISGLDLRTLIDRERRLDPGRVVQIGAQMAGALQALARAGLVHRDVKPSNVLVRDVDGRDHCYLTDFGVARAVEAEDNFTRTGWQVGTSGYMSPEQVRGEQPDSRSDLYALGCVVFEALTGQRPFTGDNDLAVQWAHASSPRPVPSANWPALGTRYDAFFAQALAVEPADRFPSGRAFAEALGSATAGPPSDSAQPWQASPSPAQASAPASATPTLVAPTSRDGATLASQDTPTAIASTSHFTVSQATPTAIAGPSRPAVSQDTPTAMAGLSYGAAGSGSPAYESGRARRAGPILAIAAALVVACGVAAGLFAVLHSHGGGGSGESFGTAGSPIDVGSESVAIAITPNGKTAYVTDGKGDAVTPINLATGTHGTPILVGQGPFAIAIANQTAYVTSFNNNDVIPINLATGTPDGAIPVGAGPFAIAITPDGKTAYVANSDDGTVTPIDLATGAPGAPITVGSSPQAIAITPDGQTVYVANYNNGTVTPISVATNRPGPPITVGSGPAALTITGKTAYVANSESNTVTPIALASGTAGAPIPVGAEPFAIAVTPDGQTAYVADVGTNTVTPIDLATSKAGAPIVVGLHPRGIAISGQAVYVANSGDDTVTPININGG
jgi:YVTN family beta-propeller protein